MLYNQRILSDFELISEKALKDPEAFIGNPVNSFLLTKKLTKDINELESTLNSTKIESKILFYQIKNLTHNDL